VFSLTTIPARIGHIRPTLEALLDSQRRQLDTVYLSIGPGVAALPPWLQQRVAGRDVDSGIRLQVLRHEHDPGPGLKLLGAARAEREANRGDTLIIYGDDDVIYGQDLVQMHIDEHRKQCQAAGHQPRAFGARFIRAGSPDIPVLEATGAISVFARDVPAGAHRIGEAPDACRFSDDFFLAYAFLQAGVKLEPLRACEMDWNSGEMSYRCVRSKLQHVETLEPLSRMRVDANGKKVHGASGFSGDWRTQLDRYKLCQELLDPTAGLLRRLVALFPRVR